MRSHLRKNLVSTSSNDIAKEKEDPVPELSKAPSLHTTEEITLSPDQQKRIVSINKLLEKKLMTIGDLEIQKTMAINDANTAKRRQVETAQSILLECGIDTEKPFAGTWTANEDGSKFVLVK